MTGTLTLLIADDNARMRATIRSVLMEAGAETVVECEDGVAAVEIFGTLRPDWVLMDLSMPGGDGISATRRIRQIDPAAKVIVVTDFGDVRLEQAARDAGAVAYVRKDNLFSLLEIIG